MRGHGVRHSGEHLLSGHSHALGRGVKCGSAWQAAGFAWPRRLSRALWRGSPVSGESAARGEWARGASGASGTRNARRD